MNNGSIGIIGGSDGPTAVYVTGRPLPGVLAAVAVGVLAVFGFVFWLKRRKK